MKVNDGTPSSLSLLSVQWPSSAGRHVADLAEVGARCQDERLAGDGEAVDLALRRARLLLVERLGELEHGHRPEGARAGVVAAVVEGEQGEHLAAREGDVAHVGVRDDLVLGEGEELVEVRGGEVVGHYFAPL
jgi:hypothetical protein